MSNLFLVIHLIIVVAAFWIINTGTGGETVIGHTPTFGGFYDGDIAEIIAYDRALPADELDIIEEYLSDKWGISLP